MERRALGLMCAVVLGLSATKAAELFVPGEMVAPQAIAPGAVPDAAAPPASAAVDPAQGHGKLGVTRVPLNAAAEGELERRLTAKAMQVGSPILIRIFKSEGLLELWVEASGRFELFATYPICNWSGTLGPKLTEGDKQSPEGLYSVGARQLHYSARWRRALDLGFPNTYDRAFKRTGSDVLVHGGCTSTGCFAMTDAAMEEIFWLSEAALSHGQKRIQVHVFPFRMTPENLLAHAGSQWDGFWANLKEAYDLFERTRTPPAVGICDNRYVVSQSTALAPGCTENVVTVDAGRHRRWRAARSRGPR
ncbi:MAG: murein L,D-transpeptidase, partial [Hyphomicrobiaceae bacterium]|nr:murein L,D-transpeptidase [Hyphomicrobiaceae bacterium]